MGARKRNGSERESDNKTDNGNSGRSVAVVNEIANELQDLFKSCKNSGLSDEQIRQCAQPVLQLIRKAYWRRIFRRCCIIVAVILLITALFYYEPFFRLFRAIGRIAFVQVSVVCAICMHVFLFTIKLINAFAFEVLSVWCVLY
jgi:hypothetical protein